MSQQKVIHRRSRVLDKTLNTSELEYGELVVNFASGAGTSFLSTKKADDTIAKFHEDDYFIGQLSAFSASVISEIIDNEKVEAAAIVSLRDACGFDEGLTYSGTVINGETATTISEAIELLKDNIVPIDSALTADSENAVQAQAIYKVIEEDELVTEKSLEAIRDAAGLDDNFNYHGLVINDETATTISDAIDLLANGNAGNYIQNKDAQVWDNGGITITSQGENSDYIDIINSAQTFELWIENDSISIADTDENNGVSVNEDGVQIWGNAYYNGKELSTISNPDSALTSASTNAVQSQAVYNALVADEKVVSNTFAKVRDAVGLTDTFEYSGPESTTTVSDAIDVIYGKVSGISIEIDSALTSASTNAVEAQALYKVIVDNEEVFAKAVTTLNDSCGFDENGLFNPPSDASYVSSESISDALEILDNNTNSLSASVVKNYTLYSTFKETKDNVTTLSGSVTALSASVRNVSGNVVNYIDSRLSTVYKYSGSVNTYANLPTTAAVGAVYNVVSGNGTIGEEGYIPAGTNYAWNGTEWDALGGSFDLSDMITDELLSSSTKLVQSQAIYNVITNNEKVTSLALNTIADSCGFDDSFVYGGAVINNISADTLSEAVDLLNTYLTTVNEKFNNYAISANVHNTITAATKSATNASSAYTDYKLGSYATSANVHNAIAAAKTAATNASSAYTNYRLTTDFATSASTHNAINAAKILSSAYTDYRLTIDYATSANTHNAINAAKTAAITAATTASSAYTDYRLGFYATSANVHNTISAVTKTMVTALSSKEDKSNKVTSISSASTDTQYPTAKCVYTLLGDVESILRTING